MALANPSVERIVLTSRPFASHAGSQWNDRGRWPAQWVSIKVPEGPFVAAYRHSFELKEPQTVRIHVTADERYELFLDGALVARGSERGDVNNWFFETYDLTLTAGSHTLAARVWSFGDEAAIAQHSRRHGFLLAADDIKLRDLLSTGFAKWETRLLTGYRFTGHDEAWGTGTKIEIMASEHPWGWESINDEGWVPAVAFEEAVANVGINDLPPSHHLRHGTLPSMMSQDWLGSTVRFAGTHPGGPTSPLPIKNSESHPKEVRDWQGLLAGKTLTIPANSKKRILIDHGNYLTAYHHLTTSKGAGSMVRINWQESLFDKAKDAHKGNRDEIEGKYFTTIYSRHDGVGDRFHPDGGNERSFSSIWWHSGRYVEVLVETADEPLTINSLSFEETRYPFANTATFEASDPRLATVIPIGYRTLQMCSHETYMDCPYYEQLQYVGDSRLQVLVSYVTSPDDRLPRKCLEMLNVSRLTSGFTQSRYPSHILQIIPPFSLWWVAMVHDFALWRGDLDYIRHLMPGVRGVLEAFRALVNKDHLMQAPDGWNFVDWVPGWRSGMAPGTDTGISGILNLHFALILRYAAELEHWVGEPELASRNTTLADKIMKAVEVFYDPDHGLYADDLEKTSWSEHAQCLALLEGSTKHKERLIKGLTAPDGPELARTTIYFTHYLFDVYGQLGRTDLSLKRMQLWFDHPMHGLKTTIEMPEPTRSDCHAWGAHPIYHFYASILGIKPTALGMSEVTIKPQLGPLTWAKGSLPTPLGVLFVEVQGKTVKVQIPNGMRVHIAGKSFEGGSHQTMI